MIYLGTLGRMVGIKCPSSQSVESSQRYSFDQTLEGRVKAKVRPIGRRTWSLQTSQATTPSEHSLLSQFASGAWGPGPWAFVPADAPHTNLLTPAAADCIELPVDQNVVPGGPVDLGADGFSAASYSQISSDGDGIFLGSAVTPLLPGTSVTGSAWISGSGGTVRIFWYDSMGSFMSSSVSTPLVGSSTSRVAVSATPPAGAVGCRLAAIGVTMATRPSVTWSEQLLPWSDGQGCEKAVVSAFSRDQVLAVAGRTYSNVSFTVTEVG